MKKHLLKINLLVLLFLMVGFANAQTFDNIEFFQEDGTPIVEGDEVQMGTTVSWEITTTTPATGTYQIILMQVGTLTPNPSNSQAWITTLNPLPSVTNGTSVVTAGSFFVKPTNNGGVAVIPSAGVFRCRFKLNGTAIGSTDTDFATNWTEAGELDPVSALTDAAFDGAPNVTFGDNINFTVNYSLIDDGNYALWVMQNSITSATSGAKTWIKTTEYPLSATSGSFPISDTFTTLTAKGGTGPTAGTCLDGDGHFTFQLRKDGVLIEEIKTDATFSTTSTGIGSATNEGFNIYPNPATSGLFVEGTEGSVIEICNIAGSVVKTQVATSYKQYIFVADLAKGMYVVKVKINGESLTKKLLIK